MKRMNLNSSAGEDRTVVDRIRKRGRLFTLGLVAGLVSLMSAAAYVQAQPPAPVTAPVAMIEENPVRNTEAAAIVAAAALNQPVEVLAYRDEYRDVFAQPDGTLIANDHTMPVRVIQDNAWVPADATVIQRTDGTIAPTAALLDMRFSTGGTVPLVIVDLDGRTMTLQWPYSLPAPVLSGDQVIYTDVFQDVDLVVNVNVEGFSNVIVLKTPEAANLPELQNLEIGVTGNGLTIQETPEGGVVALDPVTNNPVIEADGPTMWDSGTPPGGGLAAGPGTATEPDYEMARGPADSSAVAPVDLGYANGTLTLTPDPAMLADPATSWPVYLDPVFQANSNSAWAMVDSGYPNEEYWKFDGKRHERIGLCPSSCNSSQVKRLLYTIATPYAGKTILSAEFRVTMQHAWNATARDASLWLMPGGINSSTNWNNQPGGSDWTSETSGANWQDTKAPTSTQSTCTSTNQNASWNAKEAVQLAAVNKWGSITLGLKASNESNFEHSKRFCDNALLSVHYNRAPLIPEESGLTMSPGGMCVSGASRPYVNTLPKLNAVLRDPDHSSEHVEKVKGEFRVTWTPNGGTLQTRTFITVLKASGSPFSYDVPTDIPEDGVVISWDVRASDGTTWGPWSSDGIRNPCEFIFDTSKPAAPDVDSPDYLPLDAQDNDWPDESVCRTDEDWHGSAGVYGSFTFDSAASDVVEYRYGFNASPSPGNSLLPAVDGGPVTLSWLPIEEGIWTINVIAIDRTNNPSTEASCTFRVGKRPPVAQWPLYEATGDKAATDRYGGHLATAGIGVTFGLPASGPGGASDTAARLDGTPNGFLATAANVLTDTSGSFAVTAWVKVTDTAKRQVAVSQDGSGEPGFSLGVEGGSWVFRMPVSDVRSLGEWKVTAPGATTAWTFLTAQYDGIQKIMSLQVSDSAPVTAARRSASKSRGAVQLGRRMAKSGYTDHWAGDLADITLFDRLISANEITALKKMAPTRKAYWQLNAATGSVSPERAGGAGVTLGMGASIFQHPVKALLGGGHLELTGGPDSYASTPTNADMTGSFTIAARVKLSSRCNGTPMTVYSQKGANNSSVAVRCNLAGAWELAITESDEIGVPVKAATTNTSPKIIGKGNHLALVYNGYAKEFLFYVNGEVRAAIDLAVPFNATGGLQLGRSFIAGNFVEHLSGAVDDVRVYDGVADKSLIQQISIELQEQPAI